MIVLTGKGIGVFQNYYQANQLSAYSTSTVSWIPSTESFMMFIWVWLAIYFGG